MKFLVVEVVWCLFPSLSPGLVAGGSRLQAEALAAAAARADLCNLVRAGGRLWAGSAGGAETRAGAGPVPRRGVGGIWERGPTAGAQPFSGGSRREGLWPQDPSGPPCSCASPRAVPAAARPAGREGLCHPPQSSQRCRVVPLSPPLSTCVTVTAASLQCVEHPRSTCE